MALYPVDRKQFDALAEAAESTRQVGVRAAPDQNTIDNVECKYFLDVINAGTAWKIMTINERTAFLALGCQNRFGYVLGDVFIVGQSLLGGPDVLAEGAFVLDQAGNLDGTNVLY